MKTPHTTAYCSAEAEEHNDSSPFALARSSERRSQLLRGGKRSGLLAPAWISPAPAKHAHQMNSARYEPLPCGWLLT